MQKVTVTLLTILSLSLGTALAQTVTAPTPLPAGQYYLGVSTGGTPSGLTFHAGAVNALDNGFTLRGNLAVGSGGSFGIGADAIANLPIATQGPLAIYAGAGPFAALGGIENNFGINFLIGGEFRLVDLGFPTGGVFLEIGPNLNILPRFTGGFYGRGGVNLHF
jgi:hypothetical protein